MGIKYAMMWLAQHRYNDDKFGLCAFVKRAFSPGLLLCRFAFCVFRFFLVLGFCPVAPFPFLKRPHFEEFHPCFIHAVGGQVARGAKLRKWTKIFDFFLGTVARWKICENFARIHERVVRSGAPKGESGCGESAAVVSAYAAAANTPLSPTHRALLKRKREVSW